MRYAINFEKTINQLVPYYLGGRKLILYLQSLMKPLASVNEEFVDWAKETRIEASMTSQIFKLEWFLNRRFSKYFQDPTKRITIKNGEKAGTPIYNQGASDIPDQDQFKLFQDNTNDPGDTGVLLYHGEMTDTSSVSFLVYSPAIDKAKITEEAYRTMMEYQIDKYKLAGKTYTIKINK